MFHTPNFRRRTAEAFEAVAVHRKGVKVFTTNPAFWGTDYAESAKASMRVSIQMARYWRERNTVKLP